MFSVQGCEREWLEFGQGKRMTFFLFVWVLVFRGMVSLCSPGCPGTHSAEQAGLKLRNPPAFASQVLGLKVCATTAQPFSTFLSSKFL